MLVKGKKPGEFQRKAESTGERTHPHAAAAAEPGSSQQHLRASTSRYLMGGKGPAAGCTSTNALLLRVSVAKRGSQELNLALICRLRARRRGSHGTLQSTGHTGSSAPEPLPALLPRTVESQRLPAQ